MEMGALPASLSAGYAATHGATATGFAGSGSASADARMCTPARRVPGLGARADAPRRAARAGPEHARHRLHLRQQRGPRLSHHRRPVVRRDWARSRGQAARRLVTTRNGAYLASWGPLAIRAAAAPRRSTRWRIYRCSTGPPNYADDGSYRLAAEAHAEMTAKRLLRADDSTYHAVEYDVQRRAGNAATRFKAHSTNRRGAGARLGRLWLRQHGAGNRQARVAGSCRAASGVLSAPARWSSGATVGFRRHRRGRGNQGHCRSSGDGVSADRDGPSASRSC